MPDSIAQKLLLVGWDAADWEMIHPLLDAGRMPHLKRLIEAGVMGNLLTLQPMLSPIL
jgi:predicted AlkP superfamily phosphohydrolase/phosphomutase